MIVNDVHLGYLRVAFYLYYRGGAFSLMWVMRGGPLGSVPEMCPVFRGQGGLLKPDPPGKAPCATQGPG